jgi:prepilin-type N-terminal cleavage/methylation domain-containing protein
MGNVNRNKRGFTLIEVLVALVLLAIILIGSLLALNLVQRLTLKNILRDEALTIGQRVLKGEENPGVFNTRVRNFTVTYNVNLENCNTSSLLRSLNLTCKKVRVSWYDPYGEGHVLEINSFR